jgi:hypothetical protein
MSDISTSILALQPPHRRTQVPWHHASVECCCSVVSVIEYSCNNMGLQHFRRPSRCFGASGSGGIACLRCTERANRGACGSPARWIKRTTTYTSTAGPELRRRSGRRRRRARTRRATVRRSPTRRSLCDRRSTAGTRTAWRRSLPTRRPTPDRRSGMVRRSGFLRRFAMNWVAHGYRSAASGRQTYPRRVRLASAPESARRFP